jgi:hypothetical protein
MGVDEPPSRQNRLQLHAEPADVYVDRSVSGAHLPAPGEAKQFLAGDDAIRPPAQLDQQMQLPDREHQGLAPGPDELFVGQYLERPKRNALVAALGALSGGRQWTRILAPGRPSMVTAL